MHRSIRVFSVSVAAPLLIACSSGDITPGSSAGPGEAPASGSVASAIAGAGQQSYADYGGIPLMNNGHFDAQSTIQSLIKGHINTYAYLIENHGDWDDLRLSFMPAAQAAGIKVWAYLLPPSEAPSPYYPFGQNYVKWFAALGKLARTYPNLTAIAMDDFVVNPTNKDKFTRDYVIQMKKAAPAVKFYPVNYDQSLNSFLPIQSPEFISTYGDVVDGVIFPFLNAAHPRSYVGIVTQIESIASALPVPLIVMIYAGDGYNGDAPVDQWSRNYVAAATRIAVNEISNGIVSGVITYDLDITEGSLQLGLIGAIYGKAQGYN
jgi:hypothetical protein